MVDIRSVYACGQLLMVQSWDEEIICHILTSTHGNGHRPAIVPVIEDPFDIDGEEEISVSSVQAENQSLLNHNQPHRSYGIVDQPGQTVHNRILGSATIKQCFDFLGSKKVKMVLKCSMAYLLGSMAVYYPRARDLYGLSDNKHMIATVTVYFHPARTAGSMAESIFYAALALLYSLICAILSMLISAAFYDFNKRFLGYLIDLILFLGFGLGSIAFMKQKMNKPNFNTACSIASIFLVTILTKEGNVQAGRLSISRLMQSFLFIVSGATISIVVCYLVWPQSAVSDLKEALNKALDIDSATLTFITKRFVRGEIIEISEYDDLAAQQIACYNSVQKSLDDSWYELHLTGREDEYRILKRLVKSLNQIEILLSGLSSSAKIQWHLLSQDSDSESETDGSPSSENQSVTSTEDIISRASSPVLNKRKSYSMVRDYESSSLHPMFDYSSGQAEMDNPDHSGELVDSCDNHNDPSCATSPPELFVLFIYHLGPPMKSYYLTLKSIMDNIPFSDDSTFQVSLNSQHRASLRMASDLYISARESAISQLYSQDIFKESDLSIEAASNREGIAAGCGNFSYVLEEFGIELGIFMDLLEEYDLQVKSSNHSYDWMKFWRKNGINALNDNSSHHHSDNSVKPAQLFFNSLKSIVYPEGLMRYSSLSSSPSVNKTPFGLRVWRSLRIFRRADVQFGIKVGIGALIFGVPAFMDKLRPIYSRWRGEWGLITYAIIMNKSVGGTTITIPIRFVGTLLGALIAYVSWTVFPENQYILAFIGWVMSLGCFWIVLHWKTRNPFGRFILLTFNLTALYSYSLSVRDNEDDEDEGGINPIVAEIAFHRFISVFIGILWAVFITTVVLPNSARKKLRPALCIQWLRMGLIWKLDILKPKKIKGCRPVQSSTSPLLSSSSTTTKDFVFFNGISGDQEFQKTMIQLAGLLKDAPNELRLKGPFPLDEYKALVSSTQKILDAFNNITVLMRKYPTPTRGELSMIEYTEPERKELCSRIFMFFYLTSAALKLGFPLPDKLPSTDHAIDRMLAKLDDYRNHRIVQDGVENEDYVLFYSYILVSLTITEELAKIALTIQILFGTIEEEMFDIN